VTNGPKLPQQNAMPSIIAILILAALYIAALAPLIFVARKPRALMPMAGVYVACILAISMFQSGLLASATLPSLEDVPFSDGQLSAAQCTQLLTLLDDGGVIVDRRSPPRLVVARSGWEQLPVEAREAVVGCVQRAWPRNAAQAQVEVRQ
jgi:hypothetical protein